MAEDSDRDSGIGARLRPARWLLLATAAVLGAFAWLEPQRAALCAIAFGLLAATAAIWPGRPASARISGLSSPPPVVWPDGSTKAFCESLGYPACIVDAKAVLRYANARAIETFGAMKAGDPVAFKFRHPEIVRIVELAMESNLPQSAEYEERVPRQRWMRVTITPIPYTGAASRAQFHVVSFFDLTENKLSEQLRTDFIANASHELRTPLASVRGFIETIKGPAAEDPKAISRFLTVMLEQAERMSRLIDDLLSLSRIEMKAHLRPQTTVDLVGILRDVADAMTPVAKNYGVKLSLRLPKAAADIKGDRDELVQVFQNLVDNACKYGQSGGKVDVAAKMLRAEPGSPPRIEVTVRDHGPGIAAEHLPRLTERFYRVDVATSREKQGTGLGLAIVKHILNRHGARLAIASNPGEGASFSMRFYIAGSEPGSGQSTKEQ